MKLKPEHGNHLSDWCIKNFPVNPSKIYALIARHLLTMEDVDHQRSLERGWQDIYDRIK